MPVDDVREAAQRALLARGEDGFVTFEELAELVPGTESAMDEWAEFLEENDIDLVPHPALRSGDVDDPDEPYFVSDIELAVGEAAVVATLYWVGYATWNGDALGQFVFALVAAKVPRAERKFADRAAALGYTIANIESGISIDLRGMSSAHLEVAIDDYAADRGGFASIAPSRVELRPAQAREIAEVAYQITDTPAALFMVKLLLPLFVGDAPHGEVEVRAVCRIEFREWGIKWLDLSPRSCSLPAGLEPAILGASGASVAGGTLDLRGAQGCRLAATKLVTEGHALGFTAGGLHIVAARRPRRQHEVASTRSEVSHEPRPILYELVEEPASMRGSELETWVAAFRETLDPVVASMLVTRFVDGPRELVEPLLLEAIEDPSEDPHVVINALWCLWRRGNVDEDVLATLLDRSPSAPVAEQAALVALNTMEDGRSWLEQFPASAAAIDVAIERWDRRSS